MGVLLALPAAAVAKIFVTRAVKHYRSTELFLAEAAASQRSGPLAPDRDLHPLNPPGEDSPERR